MATADKQQPKTAVVLMNLGGPSAPDTVKPFLFNFFIDPNIIPAPFFLRWFIAKYISITRGRGAAKESYAPLGGKSPLLENTNAQKDALAAVFKERGIDAEIFVSMRYWHPRADVVVQQVADYGAERVILLPLYPQFSTTTSFSSIQEWQQIEKKRGIKRDTQAICCYHLEPGFIGASADILKKYLGAAPANTRVLFSAHGLPESVIKGGDPYQRQCEESAAAMARAANIDDWEICYQSRVGPKKWIGPSTEESLRRAARDGKGVLIYPHAFVSEHVETLVEIEMEYKHLAQQLGIPYFARVETVSTHPLFIAGLADLVAQKLAVRENERRCPESFCRCAHDIDRR